MRYECHITVDPLFVTGELGERSVYEEQKHHITKVIGHYGFRFASLYKANGKPSDLDSFMTGHSDSYDDMKTRMKSVCQFFTELGVPIKRFKIEEILLDSRNGDTI